MIRPYQSADKAEVIKLLRLNTPQYFDPTEEKDYEHYLENELESYFVAEMDDRLIGAGGINYFREEKTARISWDLIHPDYQGRGIGLRLLKHRIEVISQEPDIERIMVRTTQLVFPFYEKAGFLLEKTVKDFWAPGFDLYQLVMPAKR